MSDSPPLRRWLEKSKIKDIDFARELGISKPHLSLIASGQRGASLALALKIVRATDGAVPVDSLVAQGLAG